MAEWSAAVGSVFAAFTALYIATADRRERRSERAAASKEAATLVVVNVKQPQGADGYFTVEVSNYGAQAVTPAGGCLRYVVHEARSAGQPR